jgi:hypothetical protein
MSPTFKIWLSQFVEEKSPIGTLARFAAADNDWTGDTAHSLKERITSIKGHHPSWFILAEEASHEYCADRSARRDFTGKPSTKRRKAILLALSLGILSQKEQEVLFDKTQQTLLPYAAYYRLKKHCGFQWDSTAQYWGTSPKPLKKFPGEIMTQTKGESELEGRTLICRKCGRQFLWQQLAEAKWRLVNPDGSPHKESCR